MQDTLQFSDYTAMLDILQNDDVRAIFNDDQLQDAFDNNQLHQVQEQIHQSDAVKSFLCNGPLIKRIAEMQLKIKREKIEIDSLEHTTYDVDQFLFENFFQNWRLP